MPTFDDFIFSNETTKKLKFFVDNPQKMPKVVCFYGQYGTGKTSFAKYFASNFAYNKLYIDAANDSLKEIVDKFTSFVVTKHLYFEHDERPISKVLIIDEIHNLRKNDFDKLKIPFEKYTENGNVKFILCANCEAGKNIRETLTQAIYSRTHPVSFDIQKYELGEIVEKAKLKYTHLTEREIRNTLPDFRTLKRKNEMKK